MVRNHSRQKAKAMSGIEVLKDSEVGVLDHLGNRDRRGPGQAPTCLFWRLARQQVRSQAPGQIHAVERVIVLGPVPKTDPLLPELYHKRRKRITNLDLARLEVGRHLHEADRL